MSLTLTQLPREILTQITSHLSDVDILARLCGCGNRALTSILKTGGVASLDLTTSIAPQSLIDLVNSFQLQSFALHAFNLPIESQAQLVRGQSSTLQTLILYHVSVPAIFLLQEEEEEKTSSDDLRRPTLKKRSIITDTRSVWMIRDSYPRLKSFQLHQSMDDVFVALQMICGLPASLTDLHLRDLPFMDIIGALPPSLINIDSLHCAPTAAHAHILKNLDSLTLSLIEAPDVDDEPSLFRQLVGKRWSIASLSKLQWPEAHLSKLNLICGSAAFLRLPPLPQCLVEFSVDLVDLVKQTVAFPSPSELLRMIPSTVTFLTLRNIHFEAQRTLDNDKGYDARDTSLQASSGSPVLHNVKKFVLYFYGLYTGESPELESSSLRDLISMVPNAHYFDIRTHRHVRGFKPEDLKRFRNPLQMQHLGAHFHQECFPREPSDPNSLQSIFPNLQSLKIEPSPATSMIHCAGLPAGLTGFSCTEPLLSQELEYLPRSIRKLSLQSIEMEGHFESQPFSSQKTPPVNPLYFIAPTVAYSTFNSWLIGRSDSDGAIRLLQSLPHSSYSIPVGFTGLGNVQLKWPASPPSSFIVIPQGQTELSINSDLFPRHLSLPSLTKLRLEGHLKDANQLSSLPALVDLTLALGSKPSFSNFEHFACPPNLTRLVSRHPYWPFSSLPASLTHLEAAHVDFEQIATLKSLMTFRVQTPGPTRKTLPELTPVLPSSLKELEIPLHCESGVEIEEQLRNFWSHFPSLKTFAFRGTHTHALVEQIYDSLPISLTSPFEDILHTMREFSPALLASRVGLSQGGIVFYPGESLQAWVSRMMRVAYPRLGALWRISSKAPLDLAALSPCLSSSTEKLILINEVLNPLGPAVKWPAALTTLILETFSCETFHLPPTLRTLIIRHIKVGSSDALLRTLPKTMTHLEIPAWEEEFVVPPWPPGLTRLATVLDPDYCKEMLKALPQALYRLDLPGMSLADPELFDLLPPKLDFLHCKVYSEEEGHSILEMCKRRGLVWVCEEKLLLGKMRDIIDSELDALFDATQVNQV